MNCITISPGRIITCWKILRKVNEYSEIPKKDLLSILKITSLGGGGLPFKDGLKITTDLELIKSDGSTFILSDMGKDIIKKSNNEFPEDEIYKILLLNIIIHYKPDWITFAYRKIEEIKVSLPNNWREVLEVGNLLSTPLNDKSQQWWKKLRDFITQLDNKMKKATGELGERLTINYEYNRLISTKFPELAKNIIWKSKESDVYGYDIASFFGDFQKDDPYKNLCIEVKSSKTPYKTQFIFYISRNEWNVANENLDNYYFYLWNNIITNDTKSTPFGPYIIPAEAIRPFIPKDQNVNGEWITSRIVIRISDFKSKFINNLY